MSELSPHRSLPRAEWQRTVGTVLFSTLIGDAFDTPVQFTITDYRQVDSFAREYATEMKEEIDTYTWSAAYNLSERTVVRAYERARERESLLNTSLRSQDSTLHSDLQRYTFYREPQRIMSEALDSAARFPLNLLAHISEAARATGLATERFNIRTLGDMSDLLTSNDIRSMLHDALITHNGFWGSYSTAAAYPNTSPLYNATHNAFVFDGDEVRFSTIALRTMRHGITRNNAVAQARSEEPSQDVTRMSSSGCIARHTRPAPSVDAHEPQLIEIAHVFDSTPEELVGPRKQSVVDVAIDSVAGTLDRASDYFEECNNRLKKSEWVLLGSDKQGAF